MINFDFWSQEWPVIVAAPHLVLGGLAVVVAAVFVIVRWGYSREIAGQKAEIAGQRAEIGALNERLRLASDEQSVLTRHIERLSGQIGELKAQIEQKATLPALATTTATVSETIGDVSLANSALGSTLTLAPGRWKLLADDSIKDPIQSASRQGRPRKR